MVVALTGCDSFRGRAQQAIAAIREQQLSVPADFAQFFEHFERLALTHDCDGNTLLAGPIVDHTALHSILLRIRDLNLQLISVRELPDPSEEPPAVSFE